MLGLRSRAKLYNEQERSEYKMSFGQRRVDFDIVSGQPYLNEERWLEVSEMFHV